MTKKLLLMGMVMALILVLATTAFAQEMAPSVTVEDQPIVDDTVTVAKVVAPQDGWMVIHAQKDGSIGPVIGHAPVMAGENENVVVPIDASAATETLYAMLHVDEGEKGAYEFPGPDGPVVVDGKPLAPAFMVTGGMMEAMEMAPSVTVEDQPIVDGAVTVAKVVAPQDGWMVIHAQKDGSIGPVIGHAPVTAGENMDVVVPIDTDAATETLYAMLHVDEGEKGAYEFPGPDGPVVVDGKPLAPAFMVTGGMMEAMEMAPSVTVEDQPIVDGTVTVAKVVAPQDGWMVIHAQKDGSIGPVIGHAPVTAGENMDVVVTIDASAATETLYAMLHVDEGEKGAYEFPGPDGPVVVDGKPLAPAFMVTGGMGGPPETLPVTGASQVETTADSRALLWGMFGALLLLAILGARIVRRRSSQG